MKKNNFNLDIFFKELSNSVLSDNADIDDIIIKANDNKDFVWKGDKKLGEKLGYKENEVLFFNPNYSSPELIFPILDKSLRCTSIFSLFNEDNGGKHICVQYVYLSSIKKDNSFLIKLEGVDANTGSYPIKMFNKIKKKEFDDFPNLILQNYKTAMSYGTIAPRTIFLNDNYKWDLNYLSEVLDKSLKERIKHAKESKELGLDYDHSIIIKMGKKATTAKVLK